MEIRIGKCQAGYTVGIAYGRYERKGYGLVVKRPIDASHILPGLRYLLRKRKPLKEIFQFLEGAREWARYKGTLA